MVSEGGERRKKVGGWGREKANSSMKEEKGREVMDDDAVFYGWMRQKGRRRQWKPEGRRGYGEGWVSIILPECYQNIIFFEKNIHYYSCISSKLQYFPLVLELYIDYHQLPRENLMQFNLQQMIIKNLESFSPKFLKSKHKKSLEIYSKYILDFFFLLKV